MALEEFQDLFSIRRLKEGDNLPSPMSNQKFNEYIKEVARKVGLTESVRMKRTEVGKEQTIEKAKYEFISSHTARRSFATNMYKRGFPTLIIMNITGHTTEKSFLKYIKVGKAENAELMLRQLALWAKSQDKSI